MSLDELYSMGIVVLLGLAVVAVVVMGGVILRFAGRVLLTIVQIVVSIIRLPFDIVIRFLEGR